MPVDLNAFEHAGPDPGHLHAVVRLNAEIHAAQSSASSFLPETARVRHTLPGFRSVALRCTPESLEKIAARPEAVSIAPDDRVHACLEHTLEAAQVPPVWEEGLTGKGVRLALLDTGIDRGHPDFEGRVAAFEDFTGRGVRDDSGHGTYVASVAAGLVPKRSDVRLHASVTLAIFAVTAIGQSRMTDAPGILYRAGCATSRASISDRAGHQRARRRDVLLDPG